MSYLEKIREFPSYYATKDGRIFKYGNNGYSVLKPEVLHRGHLRVALYVKKCFLFLQKLKTFCVGFSSNIARALKKSICPYKDTSLFNGLLYEQKVLAFKKGHPVQQSCPIYRPIASQAHYYQNLSCPLDKPSKKQLPVVVFLNNVVRHLGLPKVLKLEIQTKVLNEICPFEKEL